MLSAFCLLLSRKPRIIKFINCFAYKGDFFHCHHRAYGEAKALVVDLLCDGVREMVPVFVSLLFVGRNGVVNVGLDVVLGEVVLELIAGFSKDHEEVPDIV